MSGFAAIKSETGYDTLLDGWALISRILAGPCTEADLLGLDATATAERLPRRLARLEREGFIRREGERWVPASNAIQGERQESIVTSISRCALPLLTTLVQKPDAGFIVQLDLSLSPERQAALRSGPVRDLLVELAALSDAPCADPRDFTTVIAGTSDVPVLAEPGERTIETLRRCARQRSTPSLADRAVLTTGHGLFGEDAAVRAVEAMRRFAASFERDSSASSGKPTSYTLLLAFGAQQFTQGET